MKHPQIAKWGLALSAYLGLAAQGQAKPAKGLSALDIAAEPTRADWVAFLRADEKVRERLWTHHARQGRGLGHWAWGWRLGWVRACAKSERPYCAAIMREALHDKALVVRAEAAGRFGERFEGSGNREVIDLLVKAYGDARNYRGGKPLFVQQRILYALKRIGGESATDAGARLAKSHPTTERYWSLLSRG